MQCKKKSIKLDEVWVKAEKHQQASKVGTPVQQLNYELCSCCDQIIAKQPISMWEHTKELQVFGFGYPLWFSFLKYCIILMLVLIASKTASQLYMAADRNWQFCYGQESVNPTNEGHILLSKNRQDNQSRQMQLNLSQNGPGSISSDKFQHEMMKLDPPQSVRRLQEQSGHHKEYCTSFMVFLSVFKRQKMSENYFLKGVQFFIHLIALIAVRNMILKQQQYYDQRSTLISKYSIIIHNLPDVDGLKRKIQTLFQDQFGMYFGVTDAQIMEFIYVFKDEDLMRINRQKEQNLANLLKSQAQENLNDKKSFKLHLQNIQQELEKKVSQTRNSIDNDSIKCNKMIVVMKTEGDKASVLYSFKQAIKQGKDFSHYFYNSQQLNDQIATSKPKKQSKILMKEAPQPNEIIWQHIDESDQDRKLFIIRGYLLTFLFLAAITGIFYLVMLSKTKLFLKAYNMEAEDPGNSQASAFKIFATFIVFIAIICVVLFNKFVMGNVLHKFVHMEHHAYTDKQNHSFAIKYALGMFFTTALMTLAVEAITYNNFYSHPYGVIEEQTIMFFVTAFIVPLIWLIHPYQLAKNSKRKKKYGTLMSQKQANELVEDYPYMLGKRYAEIFQIIWFTFLYSELIPLGSFLMLVGLVLYYWVDKYNFLRRSAVKTRVSGKMAILGLKSLDATLFICPAGQLLFQWLLHHRFDYPSLIFTFLGMIYTLMPITSLIWQVNGQKFLIEQKTYEEARQMFKQTYKNMHPVYKLTHKQENQQHKEQVQNYYRKDMKKVKHYGTGRGNYQRKMTIASEHCNTAMQSQGHEV